MIESAGLSCDNHLNISRFQSATNVLQLLKSEINLTFWIARALLYSRNLFG